MVSGAGMSKPCDHCGSSASATGSLKSGNDPRRPAFSGRLGSGAALLRSPKSRAMQDHGDAPP